MHIGRVAEAVECQTEFWSVEESLEKRVHVARGTLVQQSHSTFASLLEAGTQTSPKQFRNLGLMSGAECFLLFGICVDACRVSGCFVGVFSIIKFALLRSMRLHQKAIWLGRCTFCQLCGDLCVPLIL